MSADYLREILTCTGDEQLSDINAKIGEIMHHITVLKGDVKNVIEDRSVNFQPYLKENGTLKTKLHNLTNQVMVMQSSIKKELLPQLTDSMAELQNMSTSMRELTYTVDVLTRLGYIRNQLQKAMEQLRSQTFYQCSQTISALQDLVKSNIELCSIEVFKYLSNEIVVLYELLLFTMAEEWSDCVLIKIQNNKIVLEVNTTKKSTVVDIIKATYFINDNLIERRFSQKMLRHLMKPIILHITEITTEESDDRSMLTVSIGEGSAKPQYDIVFDNIIKVIEFIKNTMDVQLQQGTTFVSLVGSTISKEFTDSLLNSCLAETIPSKLDDLDNYKNILSAAAAFQSRLQTTGFLPLDCTSIIDYANNINVLFANKCCQAYLNRARNIMKQDLHNMVHSREITLASLDQLPQSVSKLLREKLNCLHESALTFPECQISKSAEEILILVDSILEEVLKSQDLCAVRLFYTVRNIFEMYNAVVPLHHSKFLETIPQQVAIFHNNCLYFTYCLVQLACDYKPKLPQILREHCAILLEEAIVLRRLGTETLEGHISSQKNQIVYILRDSGLATLNEDPKLNASCEKSVRQCMRQLQILQSVWAEVLPLRVYNNVMGFLLDAFIEELTALVLAVEDISSDTATDLATIFTLVQQRTPPLFMESKQVHRYARKWQRFGELISVLQGGLKDINERWADGVGPLAYEFTADQVKHLIRALFQNTERRAALLARIK